MTEYHDFVEYGLTFEPYIQFLKFKKLNNLEFHQDHESQSASSCRDHGTIEIPCLITMIIMLLLLMLRMMTAMTNYDHDGFDKDSDYGLM